MLKALELVGFKSFADRTRFEFPPGITAVVGPNGSGKSNVVDAIKWVLGEQSVKSLRGKEMADVIFNGSDSRVPLNSAESTLTFENATGFLPIDTPEVHITRRVYRSGEGEYLINRQPSRLRDIRDLFAGTGVTTEAYSVIEQGKVDVLLQTSPKDRRAIFEEAAGISRFKAKKVESLRRLERVEQNLLRLADIVDEVDNRLRSVRKQATKARRYKQYADRLQDLRTQVGLADWRRLGEQLAAIVAEQAALREDVAGAEAEAEVLQSEAIALETAIAQAEEALRTAEGRGAENRERLATRESTIEHERRRCRDLEEEIARHRQQLSAMNVRAGDLEQQLHATSTAVRTAEDEHQRISQQAADDRQALAEITERLETLRRENERHRSAYMEQMRSASSLASEIGSRQSQLVSLEATLEQGNKQLAEFDANLASLDAELHQNRERERELATVRDRHAERNEAARAALSQKRRQHAELSTQRSELQQRLTAATERSAVLTELERRLEGISAAAKELLLSSRDVTTGPLRHIRGLVADLFDVEINMAPLVETALGDLAQYLVVAPGRELLEYVESRAYELSGRVGLVRLDNHQLLPSLVDEIDLEGQPGVLGRADRFVETAGEYKPLARRLLGRTWIVEKLPHALSLSESIGRGLQFVTLAGEKIAPDGTIVVGPRQSAAGIISRRSELKALAEQIEDLESRVAETQSSLESLAKSIAADEEQLETLASALEAATEELAGQRSRVHALESRRDQVCHQRSVVETQCHEAKTKCETTRSELDAVRTRLQQTESRLAELETRIADEARRLEDLDEERQRHHDSATTTMVRLAKSEERLGALRTQMLRFEQDQQERHRAFSESSARMAQCTERAAQAQRNILEAESEVAELYLAKEALATETVALVNQRETDRQRRGELGREAAAVRERIRKLEEHVHAKELAASEIRLQRDSLVSRLRDDYGVELDQLDHEPTPEELHQRDEVEQEIADLRRKINNIGNVNLDALAELEELEDRFEKLSTQHRDLANAKASLEQIIAKINADSRRLFAETLETVRGHFQSLFRKLFGGGQADIVLEEGIDILDSGVEIVARPPGKEPRSISLLSGGEKTLTCVALLLAIFRSRPSPFCVLDEVDAALDEANIERFIAVLKDFLAWTQFIIVTHSKKTMTCANSLYGVTMQESGISKRVSVHFDDVSEDGEIRPGRSSNADATPRADRSDDTQAA